MIFNMNGGGTALNFRVLGGTSTPSDPKENTIWVNTSTTITDWVFSATQPTSATGRVWFLAGASSTAEFNVLKKNSIQVYPISAKQYVNGAWVDKTAKTYQGGAWVDWWNGELFDSGNQYEAITGGWVQGSYEVYGGENASSGSFTVGNNIDLTANGGQSCVSVRTAKKIDLTRFNTVTATFTGNGYVLAASATSGVPTVLGASGGNIDVSTLSGEYYVGVMARNYQEMHVSKINLH